MVQVEDALMEDNSTAVAALHVPPEEGAWEHMRTVLERLVQGHEGTIAKLPCPSAGCYSLQVVGCFQAGEFLQVCLACCCYAHVERRCLLLLSSAAIICM